MSLNEDSTESEPLTREEICTGMRVTCRDRMNGVITSVTAEEVSQTPRPNLLDVVKIDGRWAQVIISGHAVRYLDNKDETKINWDDYNCQFFNKYNSTYIWVSDLVEESQITQEEYESVVFGSISDPPTDTAKMCVTVFGIYTKK